VSTFFGYHAMFDCAGCDKDAVRSKDAIAAFIKDVIVKIDMVAVGEPIIEYLCEGDPKEGYSFVQLISTSNITGHLMNTGEVYIDIFSCKNFDPKVAEQCIKDFCNPAKIRPNFLIRDAG
jgi:S-adenosylmethionine/arginine decarboxylase-like enzyme